MRSTVGDLQSLSTGLPVICYNIRGNNDLIKDEFNGYFIQSYKDVPNKIYYLNLNTDFYYRMSLNALKSIDQEFSRKNINLKIYNIIKNYFKY